MKKFTLSILEPCHENWNTMSPEEKGRFCSSCRKTVVDFTNMSDRQIAAFFQKPSGSLCGRFYNDQLNREIVAPKKRQSWLVYFFQFTWPAFVLFLKSCGQKQEVVGEIAVRQEQKDNYPVILGTVLSRITPVDTNTVKVQSTETVSCGVTTGDVDVLPIEEAKDKISTPLENIPLQLPQNMDSIAGIIAEPYSTKLDVLAGEEKYILMGGLSITHVRTKVAETAPVVLPPAKADLQKNELTVYPNPVSRGQTITVASKENFAGVYRVLSASGQLMRTGKLAISVGQEFFVPVQSWPAGAYILLLVEEASAKKYSQSFIVR